MDYRNKCGNDKIERSTTSTPMQAERTHTAASTKQNRSFTIRTVGPSADTAGAVTGPTLA
jgi:hypothetical protein